MQICVCVSVRPSVPAGGRACWQAGALAAWVPCHFQFNLDQSFLLPCVTNRNSNHTTGYVTQKRFGESCTSINSPLSQDALTAPV